MTTPEKKNINFFPYTWHVIEEETNVTCMRIYGLDEKDQNVCLRVDNFTPWVYIELPARHKWNATKSKMVENKIDELLGSSKPLIKCLMFKKRLYGAQINYKNEIKKFPYIFCNFSSKNDIRTLEYKLRTPLTLPGIGSVKLKIHEQDASPILQMTSIRNIPTAGWFQAKGVLVKGQDKVTSCHQEYQVKYKDLSPLKEPIERLAEPLIMSFDIECNSSNPNAMPEAKKKKDKVFQISCVLSKKDQVDKYLLSLGSPNPEIVGSDVKVITFKTEADLLVGYKNFLQEKNPNLVVGYNILGFDIPYLIERAKGEFCYAEFIKQGFDKGGKAKETKIKWSSSAYGNQEFDFLDAEGRLYVDLLPLVKRDFKFSNYKLTTISEYFLGSSKDPLSPKGIFKCYLEGMKGGKKGSKALGICGKYCVQDSALVLRLLQKLETWCGLCEMAKTCSVPIFYLYTKGQQIKVYSQVYKYCLFNNFVVEKDGYKAASDEHYTGAKVFDPIPGVYDKVLPFDFSSLYPTVIIAYNIDYSTIALDPNIEDNDCHIIEWEDHQGCEHDPKVVKKLKINKKTTDLRNAVKKLRERKKTTSDRYILKKVDSQISCLQDQCKKLMEDRKCVNTVPKHKMCTKRRYRFLKEPRGVLPTVLQNLLDARKNTRKEIKQIKNRLASDKTLSQQQSLDLEMLCNILNKRQLSYKVSCNSMYGAMGVQRGYLPFMPGAMATTAMGRKSIELAARSIQNEHGGKLIYGDTDSNYVVFPELKTASECWDRAEHVANEVSKLFRAPMKLEFEEVIYWRFLILTKKRYMSLSCGRDGQLDKVKDENGNPTDTNQISKKGVLLARRDNSNIVKKIYSDVVMMIFEKKERDVVLNYIIDRINELCSHTVHLSDFVVTKSVGDYDNINVVRSIDEKGKVVGKCGNYTVSLLPSGSSEESTKERNRLLKLKNCSDVRTYYLRCLPAQVQLADKMGMRGHPVSAGTRLEYVVTDTGNSKHKQYEKVESVDYFKHHSRSLKLDYLYYLKSLATPLDQVLNVLYFQENSNYKRDFVMNQYNYRLKTRQALLSQIKSLSQPKIILEKK